LQNEPAAVVLEGASRTFGDVEALRDLSLRVETGSILGVIGPSGAGKTTAIRLMTGGLAPTEGTVQVLGEDPRHLRRRTRENIGYLPQQFTLYPYLTARENVGFVASIYGLIWFRHGRRVKEALKLVDLWDVRNRLAARMSGGMLRRLELAAALVHDPALLLLDEPTAGLDPILRESIWTELHRLKEAGRTLIVTTQHVNEAEECDQVALISGGRLIAYGTPDELRREALGGQAIEVDTEAAFEAKELEGLPGVLRVIPTGPHTFQAVVDDAGTATPDVVEAITARGATVKSAREYVPSFDDVFATLVERASASEAGGETQVAA
jgi:ABC-2 type transport system ATP-binding protein